MQRWTRRKVCRTAAAAAVLLVARRSWAKDPPGKAEVYAKDVEFLLDTFGKKAAALLKQKGVDWKAVDKEFTAAAKAVRSDGDHLKLCGRLIARLRDGHAGFTKLNVPWPDESSGRKQGGPGVFLTVQDQHVLVKQAWSNAADAGLAPGVELRTIDDKAARAWLDAKAAEMRDTTGYSTDHQALYAACHWGLGDWQGTSIEFAFAQKAKIEKAKVVRGRASVIPVGPVFPPKDLKETGRQSYGRTAGGFGYLHLRDVPGELPAQIDEALAAIGDAPGLILDCRANGGGGCDHEAAFGRFVPAGTTWQQYKSAGAAPFAGPMVVLVDAGVRSAGETVAGMFKEDGRAYMIGEGPTAGMASQKEEVTVPSGMFTVRFSVASNKGRFNGGRGIEGIGVPPHEVVPYDAADLAKGVDTEIRRAEELLRGGFPKGVVRYAPGR